MISGLDGKIRSEEEVWIYTKVTMCVEEREWFPCTHVGYNRIDMAELVYSPVYLENYLMGINAQTIITSDRVFNVSFRNLWD